MRRTPTFCIILLVLLSTAGHAQDIRSRALGGISYALEGEEFSLGLYTFGQNPAWLARDRTHDFLDILPSVGASWGDYRRLYDPKEARLYGVGFDGVKPLGDAGTFRGYASYTVDKRRGVYRSLKRSPYNGEAFFVTDTTSGNFTYNGPTVGFMYSYHLLSDVHVGAGVRYQVLDGLKDVYTMAKTLYRNVGGTLGVAWEVQENLVVGVTGELSDSQERIESQSDNLLDVEVFNYRGETYATHRSGGSLEEKVKTDARRLGVQIDWRVRPDLELAVCGSREVSDIDDLKHLSSDFDSPEGFTSVERTTALLHGQYRIAEDMMIGVSIRHGYSRFWSKQPALNLLLWDSKWNETAIGGGITWAFSSAIPLVGLEYEFILQSTDSLKYIDNHFVDLAPRRHRVSIGAEVSVLPDILLRAGYRFEHASEDLITGGTGVNGHAFTLGADAAITSLASVQAVIGYETIKNGSSSEASRSGVVVQAKLRLLAF